MAEIVGIYDHERSENFDEYLKAVGVPWMGRKVACASNPRIEIGRDGDKWIIKNSTVLQTTEVTFVLGVEYEESMPFGQQMKNISRLEGNSLVTTMTTPIMGSMLTRRYDFTDEGLILTLTHEKSGQVTKRFFKRVVAM